MADHGLPEHQALGDAVEAVLQEQFPIAGAWVLGVEVYDAEGSPFLITLNSTSGTIWNKMGIVRGLMHNLDGSFNCPHNHMGDEEDE